MTDPREGYLEQIRQSGVTLSPGLAAAFAAVPREVFVPDGFHQRDGTWVAPTDPDFRATVYRDDVLVTKMDGPVAVSSSSQPSLMAIMIEALAVRPGSRVLEVGAGTGYNAALLATLGAAVTSIDVQADVADRARVALARAGVSGVRVEQADGYAGVPGERFDRVIVTVGVAGVSPHWLDQLDPDGFVVAPILHAGMHPVLAVRSANGRPANGGSANGGSPAGRVVCGAGFMSAAGPLNARHAGSFPRPAGLLDGLAEHAPARFDPPLEPGAYRDLWYAAGAWDRRASHAVVPGREPADRNGPRPENTYLALLGPDRTAPPGPDQAGPPGPARSAAVILTDGGVLATGGEIGNAAVALVDRWVAAGRPPMEAWQVGLARTADPAGPIWAPDSWSL